MKFYSNFPVKAIHIFQIRTLRLLGYQTRVVLNNKFSIINELTPEYRIDLNIYSPDGSDSIYINELCILKPNNIIHLDFTQ